MIKENVILLVEDNPDDEMLTIRAMKQSNIANDIVITRNGVEALDYMFGTGKYEGRDVAETPAMILLDLKLPKIDGMEVLRRIKADSRTKRVPVVILTSSKEEKDLASGYDLGVNSYIAKPVDFDQFGEAVKQIGLYWLVINERPPENSK